jgi:hypothetical protein
MSIMQSNIQFQCHQIKEHASKTDLTNEQQPNAITMAEHLKDEPSLQKKAKLGDGTNITAEDR